MRRAPTAHLPNECVANLAKRPGLGTLASVLGVPERERIAVAGHMFFRAQLPAGDQRQVVRASPLFFGKPWYDHLEYRAARSAGDGALRYGQVRLLVRGKDGEDTAVVAEMERVVGADECPLSARGCTQLRWSATAPHEGDDGSGHVKLRAVPVLDIVRVVHIVPDCADMGELERVGETPPAFGQSGQRLWNIRYLLSPFPPASE